MSTPSPFEVIFLAALERATPEERAAYLDDACPGVRGPERVAKLPEAEQHAWRKLWADVEAMLARAQPMTKPE
jgi:hypothetical protein